MEDAELGVGTNNLAVPYLYEGGTLALAVSGPRTSSRLPRAAPSKPSCLVPLHELALVGLLLLRLLTVPGTTSPALPPRPRPRSSARGVDRSWCHIMV